MLRRPDTSYGPRSVLLQLDPQCYSDTINMSPIICDMTCPDVEGEIHNLPATLLMQVLPRHPLIGPERHYQFTVKNRDIDIHSVLVPTLILASSHYQ